MEQFSYDANICFTGLSFTDVQHLTPKHIVYDNNGEYWIRKPREKTDNMSFVMQYDNQTFIFALQPGLSTKNLDPVYYSLIENLTEEYKTKHPDVAINKVLAVTGVQWMTN